MEIFALDKYDHVIPFPLWQKEYESITDFKYVIFEKIGHTPQLEQEKSFNEELISWLRNKF